MVCNFRLFLGPFSFKYRRQLLEQIFANFMRGNLLKDSYDSLGKSLSSTSWLLPLPSSSSPSLWLWWWGVFILGDFTVCSSSLTDLKKLLTEPAQVSTWHTQGLPRDQYSIENAVFISRHKKYPLIIDPQVD